MTLDGAPLYTFAEDGGPGKLTGDGFSDQFDGMSFDWHADLPGGSTARPAATGQQPTTLVELERRLLVLSPGRAFSRPRCGRRRRGRA